MYAGEDVHGGANATLHAVASFLQDRGAVLEDHWDWDYGVEYPPVDPGLRGGPYPGSEYPDRGFDYREYVTPGKMSDFLFPEHQLKYQISARIPPTLVDELAARPDVVALDVYGKWVGTPEFMFYNTDASNQLVVEEIVRGADPVWIYIVMHDAEPHHKNAFFSCPHKCFDEWPAVDMADKYYDGMRDRHVEWLASFIEDRGGVVNGGIGDIYDWMKFNTLDAHVSPSLWEDLENLRIVSQMGQSGFDIAFNTNPIQKSMDSPIKSDPFIESKHEEYAGIGDGDSNGAIHPKPAAPYPEEPRCESGRIPFERPSRGDTVCVYPETAERLEARGPW